MPPEGLPPWEFPPSNLSSQASSDPEKLLKIADFPENMTKYDIFSIFLIDEWGVWRIFGVSRQTSRRSD